MAGNLGVEPVLDLLDKIKDLDRHGESPLQVRWPAVDRPGARVTPRIGITGNIAYLDDRLQYLSVNVS
jgi:hypothetical protein